MAPVQPTHNFIHRYPPQQLRNYAKIHQPHRSLFTFWFFCIYYSSFLFGINSLKLLHFYLISFDDCDHIQLEKIVQKRTKKYKQKEKLSDVSFTFMTQVAEADRWFAADLSQRYICHICSCVFSLISKIYELFCRHSRTAKQIHHDTDGANTYMPDDTTDDVYLTGEVR